MVWTVRSGSADIENVDHAEAMERIDEARNRVLQYLTSVLVTIQSIREAQSHLLRAFTEAQRVICEEDPDGVCKIIIEFYYF